MYKVDHYNESVYVIETPFKIFIHDIKLQRQQRISAVHSDYVS